MTAHVFDRAFQEIALHLIRPPSLTARTRMSEEKMDSLVAKIRAVGFQSVIGVFPVDDVYEVVFGHRRFIAAGRAGIAAIPCFVYPSRDKALEALKHMENAEREEMRPTEEAIYFDELLARDCGGDTDALAAQLSLKRDYVERRLLLLAGHREVFDALDAEDIGIGIAEQINKCPDPQHARYMLHQAVTCGWTVGVAAQEVYNWRHLHSNVQPPSDGTLTAAVPSAPLVDDYFTCRACGGKENPGNMRAVQIHDYCQQATLLPALDFFQRRSEYVRRPRTERDAVALLHALLEEFPALGDESVAAT